ncbi:hypothetical protein D3C80_1450510 [compost metagenome]
MLHVQRLVDFNLAIGSQYQGAVGLVHRQYMQDVAVRIELAAHQTRQLQMPFQNVLALGVFGRQAQELDAGAHFIGVAVGSVVAYGQFHTTSR